MIFSASPHPFHLSYTHWSSFLHGRKTHEVLSLVPLSAKHSSVAEYLLWLPPFIPPFPGDYRDLPLQLFQSFFSPLIILFQLPTSAGIPWSLQTTLAREAGRQTADLHLFMLFTKSSPTGSSPKSVRELSVTSPPLLPPSPSDHTPY